MLSSHSPPQLKLVREISKEPNISWNMHFCQNQTPLWDHAEFAQLVFEKKTQEGEASMNSREGSLDMAEMSSFDLSFFFCSGVF